MLVASGDASGGDRQLSCGWFLSRLGLLAWCDPRVIIAYLINDEKKHNRVKWAWIGWGIVGRFCSSRPQFEKSFAGRS